MRRNVVVIRKAAILGALLAGAAILASCATTGKKVTVLTYNTHLFQGSNAEYAHRLEHAGEALGDIKSAVTKLQIGRLFDKPTTAEVVFDDDNRAESIAQRLETCGADVVALQELWSCARPKWFADRLKKVYPHSYYFTVQCPEVTFVKFSSEVTREGTSKEAVMDQIKKKNYKLMNGLLLLSKHQIDGPVFHEFPADRTGVPTDQMAKKGVITATIVLPNGLPLQVGVTHANTDIGGPSQPDLADLADWTTKSTITGAPKTGPAIMMGDLNVGHATNDGAEYIKMANIFKGVGALDAYRQVNNRSVATVNFSANRLLPYFFPNEPPESKCIDYVFYRPDGTGMTIKPESAKVITDWKYRAKMKGKVGDIDLSDHYPVMVTFSLWNGPKPITWADPELPRAR